MNTRKSGKKTPSRRGRSRKMQVLPEEELPLSFLAYSARNQVKTRKNSTPRKRLSKTRTTVTVHTPVEVIDLDDTPEDIEMHHNVDSKIVSFMQSGNFVSSDEDEAEMIKTKTNRKPSLNPFFISDDSDDDCKINKQSNNLSEMDLSVPSTSAGTSKNSSIDNNLGIVDSILDMKSEEKSPLKDMKSLEDYRKETEEMLKNASSLLDEIKTGCKVEPEKNNETKSPTITIGSCPICLESLAGRPTSVTVCGHIFCKECILQTARTLKKCPTCRKAISSKKIHPIYF